MRLAVFSDSHGSEENLRWAMEEVCRQGKVDAFIFLGDGTGDFERCYGLMGRLSPRALVFCVQGNNDYFGTEMRTELTYSFSGVQTFMTHGHRYQVKAGREGVAQAAQSRGCRLCLYGHTHRALVEEIDGVLLVNPGALTYSFGGQSAAVVDIDCQGNIKAEIFPL